MVPRICVLIPTYDNEATLEAVVRRARAHVPDVIVVDDGSHERARDVARGLGNAGIADVRFHEANRGKGAAMLTGLQAARDRGFSHAIQIDADGQHDTDDIPRFVEAARSEPNALVMGEPIFDSSAPKLRMWARQLTVFWCRVETWSRRLADPLCGYRVYPVEATLKAGFRARAMDFDPEVAVRLAWAGTPIARVPTRIRYFTKAEGGVSHFRPFLDTVHISLMHTRLTLTALVLWLSRLLRRPAAMSETEGPTRSPAPPSAEPSRGWRSVPERGTVLGIRIVGLVYRAFGRRMATLMVWWITLYYALVAAGARRASRDYQRRIGLPGTFQTIHTHFFTFGRVALDRLVLMLGRADRELEIRRFGHELVLEAAAPEIGPDGAPVKRRGCILLGSHIGSFEAMRALTVDVTLTIVVDFRNAKRITHVLSELAPNAKLRVIGLDPSRGTSMLDVRACIDRGEFVAVLGDRVEGDPSRGVTVDFLGGAARLPIGPYLLAHMLACPVYFVAGIFTAPNRYDLFFEPFADAVKLPRKERTLAATEYAQRYARVLESFARRAPYNWFNFYDFWQAAPESPSTTARDA